MPAMEKHFRVFGPFVSYEEKSLMTLAPGGKKERNMFKNIFLIHCFKNRYHLT
jgi:hypothetical protein